MYTPTHRTTASRNRGRMAYDRDTAHAILDEAYHCTLGFVVDGEPRVLPTLHARVGDVLYLHGSTGSRPLLAARGDDGLRVCVAVTHLDGLVYARSHFHHSANYRSVVAHGTARLVTDESEKRAAMDALVNKVGADRAAQSRPPTRRELAETAVLALPLTELSVKARSGGVVDEEADLALPYWAGVVPLRLTAGPPEPDTGVTVPVPAGLVAARSPWFTAAPMRGRRVILEPLDLSHVDELLAATDDPEVWQHLSTPRPRDRADLAAIVAAAQRDEARVAWVQRCADTGVVIGSTSYYDIDETNRSVAIGYTYLGRPWWRTGVNSEAKLLLLERAFDVLGAQRVVWHTDVRNARSQAAIERLGAVREGVLRRHKPRPDGTWRDTVQYAMTVEDWPAAADRLRSRALAPAN